MLLAIDVKHTEASSLPNSTGSLCLKLAQVPPDLAIFCIHDYDNRTNYFTLAHAHGVIITQMLVRYVCDCQASSIGDFKRDTEGQSIEKS